MTGSRLPDPPRSVSVVDSVCCVYFCAAGKGTLLLRTLTSLGLEILIPFEVDREVQGKSMGQLDTQWSRFKRASCVTVLPELLAEDDGQKEVVAHVARIRDMEVSLALRKRRDMGEAIVIGHARHLSDQGHEVFVIIDDGPGQVLASREGLDILTVEDLLLGAVRTGVLQREQLRGTYESLRPFGSGLPSWDASELKIRAKRLR